MPSRQREDPSFPAYEPVPVNIYLEGKHQSCGLIDLTIYENRVNIEIRRSLKTATEKHFIYECLPGVRIVDQSLTPYRCEPSVFYQLYKDELVPIWARSLLKLPFGRTWTLMRVSHAVIGENLYMRRPACTVTRCGLQTILLSSTRLRNTHSTLIRCLLIIF